MPDSLGGLDSFDVLLDKNESDKNDSGFYPGFQHRHVGFYSIGLDILRPRSTCWHVNPSKFTDFTFEPFEGFIFFDIFFYTRTNLDSFRFSTPIFRYLLNFGYSMFKIDMLTYRSVYRLYIQTSRSLRLLWYSFRQERIRILPGFRHRFVGLYLLIYEFRIFRVQDRHVDMSIRPSFVMLIFSLSFW